MRAIAADALRWPREPTGPWKVKARALPGLVRPLAGAPSRRQWLGISGPGLGRDSPLLLRRERSPKPGAGPPPRASRPSCLTPRGPQWLRVCCRTAGICRSRAVPGDRRLSPAVPADIPPHNPGPWALGPGVGYLSQSREMTPTVPGEPPAPVQTPSPGSPPPPPLHGGVGGVCCPWIGGMWRLLSSGDSTESCAKPYTAARRAFHGSRSSPTKQVQGVPHFPGHLTRLAAAQGCEDFAHERTRTEAHMREDAEDDRVVKPAGNKIIRIKFYGHRRGVKLYRLCSFKQATATTHRPTLGAKAVHAAAPACRARDIAAE